MIFLVNLRLKTVKIYFILDSKKYDICRLLSHRFSQRNLSINIKNIINIDYNFMYNIITFLISYSIVITQMSSK